MKTGQEAGGTITLALTALVIGASAIIGAMLILDFEDWQRFVGYFVLIPVANICFAITLWLGIGELRGR